MLCHTNIKNADCGPHLGLTERHCHAEDLLNDLGYGTVHRGVWKGKSIAVRRIEKSHCFSNWKKNFDLHVNTLDSDNVLKVFDFEDDTSWRYFALELFGGTLEQFCNHQYRGPMPSDAQVLYQIAKGVDYLHKRGLAHGRLNPKAILISQSHPVKMKVSDFGLCQFKDFIPDCGALNMNTSLAIASDVQEDISHPKYWINSRLSRKRKSKALAESDDTFSTASATVHGDTFAAGCLFFYFLKKGLHPFGDTESILKKISRNKKPINLKKLDKTHFAFDSIEKLIQDPPTDGTQLLAIALNKFEHVLPLRIDKNKEYGRGTYGIVYAGTYEGNPVAVKEILAELFVPKDKVKEVKREVEGHSQMNHENVLKLLHIDEEKSVRYRYLVLELCAGTLTDYCEEKYNGPELPPDELVLYQIANGLHYIHSRDLVHRDIKPDNILISMTTPTKIKLSDFGLCKKVSHQETFSQSGLKGTANWMAQEMLEIKNASGNKMKELPHGTIGSDTFSAGCVFFYFLTRGTHPFGKPHLLVRENIEQNKPVEIESFIQGLQSEDNGKLALYNIIKNMIAKKDDRIPLSDVLAHLTPHRQFKETERVIPGYDKVACLFNPTKPVLACSVKHEVIFFTALNGLIPFSNWKQSKLKLQAKNTNKITALQWNVSFFNSDGNQLAAGFKNGDVTVWSYPAGNILFQMNQHLEEVTTIEWNPSRLDVLATIYRMNKKCLIWSSSLSYSKTNLIWTMEGSITCTKWISENHIALGFQNSLIEIWEIDFIQTTARCTMTFQIDDPTISIENLQWDESTRYLASRLSQGEIRIWSTDNKNCIYKTRDFNCSNFAWRPNKKVTDESEVDRRKLSQSFIFVCGTADGDVRIWNPLENEEKLRTLTRQHSKPLVLVVFSPDGLFLASADTNNKIIVWSTETWEPVFITRSPSLYSLKFSWLSTTSSADAIGYKFAFYTYGIYGSTVKVIEYAITETNDVQQPSVR
ncbi:hypothetical protein GHT06_012252 [Daphnia sinensis]|uniref:Protein kinase domain-containing protein n=1 Tax=Daphnia sinensis TaxID=1820382 RepID=A0AAD5LEK5_9CRUS|nr:hypothetical protein GHT06_012252 [Daphnia sinensis]